MPIKDYIISTLNIDIDDVESLQILRKRDEFHTYLLLKKTENISCPLCGGPVKKKGLVTFDFQTLPINGFKHFVHWKRQRFICKDPDCHYSFRETNMFTPGSLHTSFSLLSELSKDLANLHLSYSDIATKHSISVTLVERYADSFLNVPRITLPPSVGIDEIHSQMARNGAAYLCVMVDNKNRDLFEILPDRKKKTLSKYFESIPLDERKKVLFITMDMWDTYRDIAKKYLPNASICVDGFHVVKQIGDAFSSFRVQVMNQYPKGTSNYYLLKHWHHLLESNKYTLDNPPKYNSFYKRKMNYRDLFQLLLKIDPDLTLAFELKEMYRLFNENATSEDAAIRFDKILDAFIKADLPCYRTLISTLLKWRVEIINSFQRPFNNRKQSNALAENFNGRLREFISICNGLSNFERFRARAIYALNKSTIFSLTSNLSSKKRDGKKRGKYNKSK